MDECTEEAVQRMLPMVSAQRREQALRYKHTFGQFCCLKSWMMLKGLVDEWVSGLVDERVSGLADERVNGLVDERVSGLVDEWEYNEHGKPTFRLSPLASRLYFSISHCKTGIAVVLDDQPVGIDIEAIRKADEELIERTMNAEEQAQIMAKGREDERARTFTRFWTQKEAVVKCMGTGIESFEQLQSLQLSAFSIQTFEKEKYIYSIAYGKLHCIGA